LISTREPAKRQSALDKREGELPGKVRSISQRPKLEATVTAREWVVGRMRRKKERGTEEQEGRLFFIFVKRWEAS
jgi:hypothetical protein